MQYCVDHPEEVSKLAKVKAQVSEVKGVMMENIEKVIVLQYVLQFLFPVVLQEGERVRPRFVAKTSGTLPTRLNGIFLAVSVCNSDLEIAPYMIYYMRLGS